MQTRESESGIPKVSNETGEPTEDRPRNDGDEPCVPSFKHLERRRAELLLITTLVLTALLVGFLAVAFPNAKPRTGLAGFLALPLVLRCGLGLLIVLFLGYVCNLIRDHGK